MRPTPDPPSRTSTPHSFVNQSVTAEELLKSQTVGLVNLADFRKRRADVLEQKEKEAQDRTLGRFMPSASGTATPDADSSDGALTPRNDATAEPPKKKKKKVARGLLSFGDDEGEDIRSAKVLTNDVQQKSTKQSPDPVDTKTTESIARKLTPNPTTTLPPPKVKTKASLQAEAVARDTLRKEFLLLQEVVKGTEIMIPFVFYDGTNIPGGIVRVKKGDHVWLLLERCRKVGAELGVSGTTGSNSGTRSKDDSRRAWARVGVDDLMCVRGEVIVPHHYELYYFIANRVPDPTRPERLLFDYINRVPAKKSPEEISLLRVPKEELEGFDHDPGFTKVVDRRWYEKNKHIYPASLWKEYETGKDFEEKMAKSRRDAEGNAFFFS